MSPLAKSQEVLPQVHRHYELDSYHSRYSDETDSEIANAENKAQIDSYEDHVNFSRPEFTNTNIFGKGISKRDINRDIKLAKESSQKVMGRDKDFMSQVYDKYGFDRCDIKP